MCSVTPTTAEDERRSGDREIQLDNQPSPTRVLRGSRRNRNKTQTSNMNGTTSTTITPHPPPARDEILNDNSNIATTSPVANVTNISHDSGYSSQSASSGEQYLMDFNMQAPQVLMPSPVRRKRPPGNSMKSKHGKSNRYSLSKRKSLPVIFEQPDAVYCSPPSTPPPHHKSHRHKIKRRPLSVSDAVIGASYSFPGVRRKGSTVLLDRTTLKKRISTLTDGIVSGGATIVPVVPPTGYDNGSRQISEVYSVIPRKSHLPRYGFIIQRNPYTPPTRNRRRMSTITIAGYSHQVHVRRQQSTTSIDEINKKITQVKLERKDSKVRFSVVEDADAPPEDVRRDSIATKSDGTASQVAESVRSSSESGSESESSSSGSDSSSSEWTTDSSDSDDSGSESNSDSDTDSSYTTTTTSSSTSTSSDSSSDDSSSDGSSSDDDSSDEDGSSSVTSSMSRSTFYTTDGYDTTSISTTTDATSIANGSIATGMTDNTSASESPSKSRTSSRTSNKSGKSDASGTTGTTSSSTSRSSSSASSSQRSSSSANTSSQGASTESRRPSLLSRASSRASSFRSSSASPIKTKKDTSVSRRSSGSSSLERTPSISSRTKSILSDVINSVSPKSSPSVKRRDNKRSKKLRSDENKEKRKSDSADRKREKAEKRKSNGHIYKENGGTTLTPRDNASVVSTPSIIKHSTQNSEEAMPPNNMSTTCVIL